MIYLNLQKFHLESFTGKNLLSGFAKTGIWTFNSLIFREEEFAPSTTFKITENNDKEIPNSDLYTREDVTPLPSSSKVTATSPIVWMKTKYLLNIFQKI